MTRISLFDKLLEHRIKKYYSSLVDREALNASKYNDDALIDIRGQRMANIKNLHSVTFCDYTKLPFAEGSTMSVTADKVDELFWDEDSEVVIIKKTNAGASLKYFVPLSNIKYMVAAPEPVAPFLTVVEKTPELKPAVVELVESLPEKTVVLKPHPVLDVAKTKKKNVKD